MHELPVVQDIIRVVGDEAAKTDASRVTSITIVVGEMSSVVDESVQMYFELLAEGTPLEHARLLFEHRYATLRCSACGREFEHRHGFACPVCGGDGVLVKGTGRELYIRSFEAEPASA